MKTSLDVQKEINKVSVIYPDKHLDPLENNSIETVDFEYIEVE